MWATLAVQTHSRVLELAVRAFSRIDPEQWFALLVAFGAAVVCAWVITTIALRALCRIARRTMPLDDSFFVLARGPLRLALLVLGFSLFRQLVDLSKLQESIFGRIESCLFVLAGFWLLMRMVDLLLGDYRRRFQRRGQGQAGAMLGLVQRLAKIAALGIAAITVLDNAGVHVTALLAGLGLGGVAVALAAQKSIENLFGGLTLYLDRPVRVGNLCRFGDRLGVVEEIGLRSTRVRTLDRTLVTVANAEFANLQLENFGQRDKVWFHPTLAIRSNTPPDRLREILGGLRELLAKHPQIEADTARVRVMGFGAYSINIDISAYVTTPSLDEYFETAESLNLAILDVLAAHGSGIAFTSPAEFK
ncbi:MAG TPA: mechanosensitive ion channel domain-containing protein [Myxococcota bacterium]|nr:mechanosensitive ion channel domain-containing protein [Myxococcota bacterium]